MLHVVVHVLLHPLPEQLRNTTVVSTSTTVFNHNCNEKGDEHTQLHPMATMVITLIYITSNHVNSLRNVR